MMLAALKSAQAWLSAIPQIAVVLLVTLPLTFLLGQCDGRRSEAARQDAARAAANVEVVQRNGHANEVAANERLTDQTLNDDHKKELLDAIAEAPASAPDAARVALGCQRLRASGRNEADLPAVCRSAR